jgi:hypothetical protein
MNKHLEIEDILNLTKSNIDTEIEICSNHDAVQIEAPKSELTQINIGLLVLVLIVGGILIYNYKNKKDEENKTV